jgi:hypothetical protein
MAVRPVRRADPALPEAHGRQAVQVSSVRTLLRQVRPSRASHETAHAQRTKKSVKKQKLLKSKTKRFFSKNNVPIVLSNKKVKKRPITSYDQEELIFKKTRNCDFKMLPSSKDIIFKMQKKSISTKETKNKNAQKNNQRSSPSPEKEISHED